MSKKELGEIKYIISDSALNREEEEEDYDYELSEDVDILQNTYEQEIHLRIINCLFEVKKYVKNGAYDILENFGFSELYDFFVR